MERIIVLSNTVGRNFKTPVKTTAVRQINNLEIVSLLTSDECDYDDLVKKISNTSSHIFVDLEKKQPLNIKNELDQKGNLFNSIYKTIQKQNLRKSLVLHPIKLNDITVTATWKHLTNSYEDISGLKLGLIGTGNIGSKLVNVLTESGVKVRCFNRNINKAITVVNSVLLTKPEQVISSPDVVRRIEHSIINTSGLIVSCSEISEDLSDYISLIHGEYKIFLIGHSLLKERTLEKLRKNDIDIQRIDVGKELLSFIIGTLQTHDYQVYGKDFLNGKVVCSGGYIGDKDDLIVDNFSKPKWYYASSNGKGGVSYTSNMSGLKNLTELDEIYNGN